MGDLELFYDFWQLHNSGNIYLNVWNIVIQDYVIYNFKMYVK